MHQGPSDGNGTNGHRRSGPSERLLWKDIGVYQLAVHSLLQCCLRRLCVSFVGLCALIMCVFCVGLRAAYVRDFFRMCGSGPSDRLLWKDIRVYQLKADNS